MKIMEAAYFWEYFKSNISRKEKLYV